MGGFAHRIIVLKWYNLDWTISLAYVTGRNKKLIHEAIHTYDLPIPDYAVGDVGATIYKPDKNWSNIVEWQEHIQKSWHHLGWEALKEVLQDLSFLLLQEPENQHEYKLSYYADLEIDKHSLKEDVFIALSGPPLYGQR
ncbi:hypothetical protein DO021_17870 [Desulfobacter hydrogenophilus]|uniref:Sucrose phosphatase-like domain-containing protein n=1 Tax=Desulfobacter hydrogenophilus TaxID=2291 RepID=A0A328FAE3_9BACT|nr:HAD family hydrolase [Desulfobacter hydrogenophilus]NDY73614.1 hypothetical protein [Desulfobacter hydrogenophilus]QBH12107.1 hypothetical protein EYB58_03705 [Desulfobacter hydrogenophilus]RAM00660.1 hypothetical protein DO021_17870 [Desulfobacter hydrogenophilus]